MDSSIIDNKSDWPPLDHSKLDKSRREIKKIKKLKTSIRQFSRCWLDHSNLPKLSPMVLIVVKTRSRLLSSMLETIMAK
jgi:hypothetical protein